jgi:predicted DCC family thiol-disulfide oxidoreductase YuxK/uncharacterized membrane protein YphA (DoxX/SURF4 family)
VSTHRSAIDRWIFEEYAIGERSLAMSRMILALYLLMAGLPRYLWLGSVPESFFSPSLSLAVFMTRPPPHWLMWSIMASITVLALTFLVGWRTRIAGIGVAVLLLLGNSLTFVFGKIDHDILLIATFLILSIASTNRHYSVDSTRRSFTNPAPRWPMALHALIVSLAMFSSALPKIGSGWLDPATQSVKGHFVVNFLASERPTAAGRFMLDYFPNWLWEALDWSTIALECAFLPAMFSLRAMRVVCAVAVFFHVGIHFSMEIFFAPNLLAYGAFVEWDRVLKLRPVARLFQAWQAVLKNVRGWMLPVVGLPLALLYTYTDNPVAAFLFLFGHGVWIRDSLTSLVAAGIASWYLIHVLRGSPRRNSAASLSRPGQPGPATPPIILFDGVCGLCNRFVDWILKRDTGGHFLFAPLQSNRGRELLTSAGLPADYDDSVVLIRDGIAYRCSTAVLLILKSLGRPWSMAGAFLPLPTHLRDTIYEILASRRYIWFGRHEQCRIPTSAEKARFLQ